MEADVTYIFYWGYLSLSCWDYWLWRVLTDFSFHADLDFSFLEMNPFTLVNGEPYPLDMRGELDDTAAFKNFKKYVLYISRYMLCTYVTSCGAFIECNTSQVGWHRVSTSFWKSSKSYWKFYSFFGWKGNVIVVMSITNYHSFVTSVYLCDHNFPRRSGTCLSGPQVCWIWLFVLCFDRQVHPWNSLFWTQKGAYGQW